MPKVVGIEKRHVGAPRRLHADIPRYRRPAGVAFEAYQADAFILPGMLLDNRGAGVRGT